MYWPCCKLRKASYGHLVQSTPVKKMDNYDIVKIGLKSIFNSIMNQKLINYLNIKIKSVCKELKNTENIILILVSNISFSIWLVIHLFHSWLPTIRSIRCSLNFKSFTLKATVSLGFRISVALFYLDIYQHQWEINK